jgi:hypothetical protein
MVGQLMNAALNLFGQLFGAVKLHMSAAGVVLSYN